LTFSSRSACSQTDSAPEITSAPADLKSVSEIADPSPAPAWMTTLCPRRVSSATPAGVIATRYSLFLISVGTPTRMLAPSSQMLPPF
jgi:hypothetical protein